MAGHVGALTRRLRRAVFARRWLTFIVLGLSFFAFGAGTVNLFRLLAANVSLLTEYGWQAVVDGGGRQLDHGRGAADVLPEIVDAVGGRAEIIVDGCILRGADIVKAIALGAQAVGIGRLQGLALGAGGEAAVVRMLELLEDEVTRCLGLLGVTSFSELNPSYVTRAEPLGRSCDEVGHDSVDGDAPAGDRDAGLAGGHEDGREPSPPCLEVELERHRLLADRAVGADGVHDRRPVGEVRAGGDADVLRRAAQVAQPDPVPAGGLGELRVVGEERVQACLDVHPVRDRRQEDLAPGRVERAAGRRDADDRGRRPKGQRVRDASDDRDPLVRLARPRRVEDRHGRNRRVAHDAPHRLAVVRVG